MSESLSHISVEKICRDYIGNPNIYRRGKQLLEEDMCLLLSRAGNVFRFVVEDRFDDFMVCIKPENGGLSHECSCRSIETCCAHTAAALLLWQEKYSEEEEKVKKGDAYSREEMIERVLQERLEKAEKEEMKLSLGDNIFGMHEVKSAGGQTYSVTIRNFEQTNGYCSCPDFRFNKLGVCKHIYFAKNQIEKKYSGKKQLTDQSYPFVEIFCDPLHDYHASFYYQGDPGEEIHSLIRCCFDDQRHVYPEHYDKLLGLIEEARNHKKVLVRPEVNEKINKFIENKAVEDLRGKVSLDFSLFKINLFDYQKEGVGFSVFKSGSIIADEMGLGKTLQAIAIAVLKKNIFDFKQALIICPATLKYQWKKEIERFCSERAVIVAGNRETRYNMYKSRDAYFLIANYETIMRDVSLIMKNPPDLVILDEAQRIKNYATKTANAVKAIPRKHSLVITGTPIENRLIDLYSIVQFVDTEKLTPLWEFSMNHFYFDKSKKIKITGYFNLQQLKQKLSDIIIRREKKEVLDQLPELQEITVPVALHPQQLDMHAGFATSLGQIVHKKHLTVYDMQKIQQLLTCMRMVCDSTYLIDRETNISPKLEELQSILLDKLNVKESCKKVIIFSEWKNMLHLIENMLKLNQIGFTTLSGEVAIANRGKLIEEFENNPDCKVFLSTEAGGSGLNLQFADTVINFELPWNPAKKNQRIGRINRLGQKSQKITAINLMSRQTIEERIADGLLLKEALFDAVLKDGNLTEELDFSQKGRAEFIQQMQELVVSLEQPVPTDEVLETVKPDQAEPEPARQMFSEDELKVEDIRAESESNAGTEPIPSEILTEPPAAPATPAQSISASSAELLQTTLNQGLQFLGGLFKLATGKELATQHQAISFDEKTGEVIMRFKLPG